jgi:hypothetical protein
MVAVDLRATVRPELIPRSEIAGFDLPSFPDSVRKCPLLTRV